MEQLLADSSVMWLSAGPREGTVSSKKKLLKVFHNKGAVGEITNSLVDCYGAALRNIAEGQTEKLKVSE